MEFYWKTSVLTFRSTQKRVERQSDKNYRLQQNSFPAALLSNNVRLDLRNTFHRVPDGLPWPFKIETPG